MFRVWRKSDSAPEVIGGAPRRKFALCAYGAYRCRHLFFFSDPICDRHFRNPGSSGAKKDDSLPGRGRGGIVRPNNSVVMYSLFDARRFWATRTVGMQRQRPSRKHWYGFFLLLQKMQTKYAFRDAPVRQLTSHL